jgi:hypothetical protein
MGRVRVPVENQIAKSKKGLSKKQIEKATTVPIELGNSTIAMPDEVKNSPVAKSKWADLALIYKGTSYITSADTEAIAQLCLLYADVAELRDMLSSPEVTPALRLQVHRNIDSKVRMCATLQEKLFLQPLVRKRGLPIETKKPPKSEFDDMGL